MQVIYLVNSGGEANDLALLMARLYSGSSSVISLKSVLSLEFFICLILSNSLILDQSS